MISFNDPIHKYILKNKATSNTKTHQLLSSFGLDNVDIYLRYAPLLSEVRIVNLPPSKGTHWVVYLNFF